jgi:hypothetical protein
MNATPQRKAPGAGKQTGRKWTASAAYLALTLMQMPFGFVFWLIEQRKAQIQDRLDNLETGAP